jgi:hypothetical protein
MGIDGEQGTRSQLVQDRMLAEPHFIGLAPLNLILVWQFPLE